MLFLIDKSKKCQKSKAKIITMMSSLSEKWFALIHSESTMIENIQEAAVKLEWTVKIHTHKCSKKKTNKVKIFPDYINTL